nr:anti-sigma factor [Pontibacter aydingkolensis]
MESYAALHAVTPRPSLKNRILSQIESETPTEQTFTSEKGNNVVPFSAPHTEEASPYKWMFAASIVLFLISGMLSYNFYTKWQQAEERLAAVSASEQLMAQNVQNTSLRTQQLQEAISILRDPSYQPVTLEGVAAHPGANMIVYWNSQKQEVYIDEIKLPVAPAGMQYQLWALDDGNPVDAGMIPLEAEKTAGLLKMKPIKSAQAFAVTLEPAGGSVNPTLEQLMVMGKVKA